jgi:hypothetical protein
MFLKSVIWSLKSRYWKKEKDEGLQMKLEMVCRQVELMFKILMPLRLLGP